MEQLAQVRDQVAPGFLGKRVPHGWRKIHWSPPLGQDDPVTASVYQAAHEHWPRSTKVQSVGREELGTDRSSVAALVAWPQKAVE